MVKEPQSLRKLVEALISGVFAVNHLLTVLMLNQKELLKEYQSN